MRRRATWLAAVAVLAACGTPGTPGDASAPMPRETSAGAVRMAAVGDSITAADSPDLAGGDPGPGSWVFHAAGGELALAGGWAEWGATTAQMADGVTPVEADVLVVLAGTNDAGTGVPFEDTAANLAEIVETVGAPRVLLSAVPPIDADPRSATELNAALRELADRRGWEWVDAPAGLRDGDRFAPGMASDGLHPTEAGARVIGEAVREAVLAPARDGPGR
ncbi:SGNH/GDSL hydrolase family protein [Georgenia sp. AZ-5]|uniref:SGNH/GDSL hydrolase family protein n=1 Tax=Georgenia sp. AZ-5 TaxID=3367526 RepID=UPI003754A989